jgi:hyperosmotically inducible protein
MRFLLVLVLGIVIGVAAVWFYEGNDEHSRIRQTGEQIEATARSAGDRIQEQLQALHLDSSDITNELARTGRVIREKAQTAGQAIADATADARITTEIKAKLLRDPDVSAWHISVSTTDGVVTLSGSAASAHAIGKAMLLAMEIDGVRQVISTIQVAH